MMAIISIALAVVAIVVVVAAIIALTRPEPGPPPPPEADLAVPYREGLHAAVRLQRSAQDLEAQIWAEAARHGDSPR
jgi:hypothetical protein